MVEMGLVTKIHIFSPCGSADAGELENPYYILCNMQIRGQIKFI